MRYSPYPHCSKSLACALALFGATLLAPLSAIAGGADVDLFTGGGLVAPNIMILLDNSGSMDRDVTDTGGCNTTNPAAANACRRIIASSAISVLVNGVNPVVAGVREQNARFGLMSYVPNGGGVEVGISNTSSAAVISAAAALGNRGVGTPLGGSILDAGRYFAMSHQWDRDGAAGSGVGLPLWGTFTTFAGCAGCPAETVTADPIDLACRDSFVIFITDGLPSSDAHNKAGFWDTVGDSDGDLGVGETSPYLVENAAGVGNADVRWGDDITHAMANYDFRPDLPDQQSVITHMIGFTVDDPYLEDMAVNGGGNYYRANSAAQLATALDAATQEVFDRFADFSTAVVPTSRTLSGAAFYNVYFEPSRDPVWQGHVEAYHLAADGTIQDQAESPALDSMTGELIEPHNPFWDAATGANGLDTNTSRTLYTTIANARASFATGNASLTEALLGITAGDPATFTGASTTAGVRTEVINYVHGQDGEDEDGDSNRTELRPNVLGDVFHSTPNIVAAPSRLHIGEAGYAGFLSDYYDRDRVLYVGANDGVLHAFDAGAYSTGDDPSTGSITEPAGHRYYSPGNGSERFGYVPGLLLPQLKKMPFNYPRTFYYVDGSPAEAEAWIGSSATDTTKSTDEWTSVLITGFREGGAGYIALDVTDPDATSGDDHFPYPGLMWEFTHANLGQAWSQPVIARVKVQGASLSGDNCGPDDGDGDCREEWVMIIGGGYLQAGDPNIAGTYVPAASGSFSTKSRSILMVSLRTGQVISQVIYDASTNPNMVYSIPSSPAVIDLNTDGFADVVYIGDLGGQVWKWDISGVGTDGADADTLIDSWPAGVFFRNSPIDVGSGVFHYRSFFFPPAAAYDRGTLTLAFGSGEREALRYQGVVGVDDNNRFYVVKDRYPVGALAFVDASMTPRLVTEADLSAVTNARTDTNLQNKGFYFIAEEGEKFTSDVLIFAGFVLTTSYQPNSVDLCTAASGESFLYVFSLRDAYGFFDTNPLLTAAETRRTSVGPGLGSSPRISMGPDPADDKVVVKSSKGKIVLVKPPEREGGGASVIYWRKNY